MATFEGARVIYTNSGAQFISNDNWTFTTSDTDDGFYNIDDSVDGSAYTYDGWFMFGGHNFLQFTNTNNIPYLISPTATVAQFPATYLPGQFGLTTTAYPMCFAAGTLIKTPCGERAVETLNAGDPVLTADGRTVPVKWIGVQTVMRLFAQQRARPVRVSAGALGGGLPHTDLVLTADHALIIDGLAINAGALVNGTTIAFDPAPDRAVYYHVETEEHDIILANGAPAETYIDYTARSGFDNYVEYLDLFGENRTVAEMPLPRITSARLLPPSIASRLAGQSVA